MYLEIGRICISVFLYKWNRKVILYQMSNYFNFMIYNNSIYCLKINSFMWQDSLTDSNIFTVFYLLTFMTLSSGFHYAYFEQSWLSTL